MLESKRKFWLSMKGHHQPAVMVKSCCPLSSGSGRRSRTNWHSFQDSVFYFRVAQSFILSASAVRGSVLLRKKPEGWAWMRNDSSLEGLTIFHPSVSLCCGLQRQESPGNAIWRVDRAEDLTVSLMASGLSSSCTGCSKILRLCFLLRTALLEVFPIFLKDMWLWRKMTGRKMQEMWFPWAIWNWFLSKHTFYRVCIKTSIINILRDIKWIMMFESGYREGGRPSVESLSHKQTYACIIIMKNMVFHVYFICF